VIVLVLLLLQLRLFQLLVLMLIIQTVRYARRAGLFVCLPYVFCFSSAFGVVVLAGSTNFRGDFSHVFNVEGVVVCGCC